jgi:hypothetical protein
VTDLDRDTSTTLTGRELLDEGLPVEMRERPGAALITYRKVE